MSISQISTVLKASGLSDKESRTYTAMLGLGNVSPYQVAKKSGLKAPITYVVLDSLLQKGLVLKTPFKAGWRFHAKRIDEYLAERQQATHHLSGISDLVNSYISGGKESRVLVFEGINEIDAALKYGIDRTRNFVAFYGSAQNISPELNRIFVDWYANLKNRGIKQRVIAPIDPSLTKYRALDKEYGNEVKEVSVNIYQSESSIEIHDDFLRIVMLTQNKCVIIEDKSLAQVLQTIFELVWKIV